MNDFPVKEMAYQMILSVAVAYANMDSRKPWYLGGDIFKLPNTFDQLELRYDPPLVEGAITAAIQRGSEVRSKDEVFDALTAIVVDAVERAIRSDQESAEAFGALIVDQARSEIAPKDWF